MNSMSPEQRERLQRRLAAERLEMERLHALPDRWLAQELLRLAREIRRSVPGLGSPFSIGSGYTAFALWHVVPELARRLGAPLEPNEASNPEVKINSPERFRQMVGCVLQWIDKRYLEPACKPEADLCPVRVLFHDVANGSPIVMALDRIAPPDMDYVDFPARHVREISRFRGHDEVSAWHPSLQDEPDRAVEPEEEQVPVYWG